LIVNLLELVTCLHLISNLLGVLKTIGDPVFDDIVPRVDDQLGHSVLLSVLTVFTLLPFSTVSTSMFSRRLIVGADPGDYVFELIEGLDLEGPHVGGESGLGVQRRLGSLLNLCLCVSLHINVLGEVGGWR
jgi:hypothetical protein